MCVCVCVRVAPGPWARVTADKSEGGMQASFVHFIAAAAPATIYVVIDFRLVSLYRKKQGVG